MKILLIGISGQVGHELNKRLSGSNHEVIRTSVEDTLPDNCMHLDLTRLDTISSLTRKVSPDIIINAAAYTAVDKAEEEQKLASLINAEAVKIMAEAAKDLNAVLVHYSTDYVFDGSGDQPRDEDALTSPVNFYGKSKLDGEEFIRKSGCKHLIFRTSWVYGAHGHNFVKTMLRVGSSKKDLSVVSDQIGSPTSAGQIADATISAVNTVNDNLDRLDEYTGTYHLTGAGFTNWAEFAREIFQVGERLDEKVRGVKVAPIPSCDYPTPAKRPFNSRLDCTRLEKTFGIELDSWQSQLKDVIRDIYQEIP